MSRTLCDQPNSSPCETQLTAELPFANRFRIAWRKFVTSPFALVLIVCLSLNAVLTAYLVNTVFKELSVVFEFLNYATSQSTLILILLWVLTQILVCTPCILIAIGAWITYHDAYDCSDRPIRTAGLTLIYIATIWNFILYCIAIPLSFYGFVTAATALSTTTAEAAMWTYAFFAYIFGAIIGFYIMRLYVRLVGNIRGTAASCTYSVAHVKAVAILQIVSGGLLVIASFGTAISFASVLSAVLPILVGIMLLEYNRLMDSL